MKNKLLTCALMLALGANAAFAIEAPPPIDKSVLKMKISKSKKDKTPDELRYDALEKEYKGVTKEPAVYEALDTLKDSVGEFSRKAILGNNLTDKPIKVEFKNLALIAQQYKDFDALGWKKGSRLYIYINDKHRDAPYSALGALLAHEALHQDEFNSMNEETYAWTYEAAVWIQLSENNPEDAGVNHPLVVRENTLKKLFEKGDYTNKYIKKTVVNNPGYANLPSRSPGFEDEDL